MSTPLTGRRCPDLDDEHWDAFDRDAVQPGDYWKAVRDGEPVVSDAPGNLTHGVWWVAAPMPSGGFALARLTNHTVREEDDGTISVRPGDGSSNSILITRGARGEQFHGYIEHGVWRDA